MLTNLVTLVILGIVLGILVVAGAGLWWLLWRAPLPIGREHVRYRALHVVTANHEPASPLPIHLDQPDIHETRCVIFDMTEGRSPAHIVSVDARELSGREAKRIQQRPRHSAQF